MATSLEDLKSRIQNTEVQTTYKNILIYGPSGVGKTSLFYDAKDTLILDVEHGSSVLQQDSYFGKKEYPSKADVLQLTCWEDLQGIFQMLQTGELNYTNVVLDSITDIRDLCKDNVLETQNRKRPSEETPAQQDWGVISERMRKMIRVFKSLPLNTIYVAREYTNKDEDSGAERVKPAIGGKLEDDAPGMMDITAYFMINKEGERGLCFDLSGTYYAKDRTNRFPKVLKSPTWADFEKALPELIPVKKPTKQTKTA